MAAILLILLAQVDAHAVPAAQRAQEYMAAGRFHDAVPLCVELVKASPRDAGALVNLGLAQYMAGDGRAAAKNVDAAAALDPKRADLDRGLEQMSLGHPALAAPALRKACELDPGNQEVRQVLADALYETGHYYLAAAQLLQVTSARPSNTRAWYVLGRTWAELARDAQRQLMDKAPADSAFGLAVAADGLMQRHEYRRALVMYNSALAKDPGLLSARASAAEIYRVNGRPEWAAKEQETISAVDCTAHKLACDSAGGRYTDLLAATLTEQTIEALYWRSQAYTGLANEAFAKLAQLPESLELHRYRATLDYAAGHTADVAAELRKALAFAPKDRGLRRDLAMALGGAGDYEAAYRIGRELLKDQPGSPELNDLIGAALLHELKPEQAIPFLLKALAADRKNLSIHASLGRA